MSVQISGDKPRVVNKVQSRLDNFYSCNQSYEKAHKALDELAAQKVELVDLPAHEERYQILLSQYKKAVDELKSAAQKIREKTDNRHIDKYFRARRTGIDRILHAGQRNCYYIHRAYKGFLEGIHDQAKKIIEIDFDTQIIQAQNESKGRKIEALSSIGFSQIDQTFPICREKLIKENPDEYLRQAALYQYKLLEKKDEAAVVAFGDTWIKNLPKEATWQQVESMSFIMLQVARTNKSVDLTEYRAAVQQWLKEHPLSDNPGSVDSIPDQATIPSDQRTYVLGLLYLHNKQKLDLSPEAFQIYQRCSALYPDQHSWKIAQAFYHISNLQWKEAEQLLADLPKDDASVSDTQRYLKVTHARYHIDHLQWVEAEQLLADLPKDDASVRDTQRYLKVSHAYYHISKDQWAEAEQMLADLPKDDASVRDTQKHLKVSHAYYHISKDQWVEAEQLLADLPKDDDSVRDAQRYLKMSHAYYHISKHQWVEAEQLLADLPKDDDSVRDAQKHLKVSHAYYHISKDQWVEAEQMLADLPKDDDSVRDAQKHLKVSHAYYHISKHQWVEAEQLLADLPNDDDSVRDTQRDLDYYLKERFSSLVMDVGVTALSKFMPSSYREKATVDIGLTILQLGTSGTVRQMWVPRLLGIPDRAISPNPLLLPLSSSFHMVGDVVDCVFRNIAFLRPLQSYESFTSYTLRMGHAAWTFKDPLHTAWKLRDPLQPSLTSVMNLGSLFISATQSLDACREIRRPASTQAFLSTLQLMASDVIFGAALASYPDLLPVVGSRLRQIGSSSSAKSLSVQTISGASSEGEGGSKNKWVLGAVVVGSLAGFRFYRDYPYLWAASVMRDVEFYSYQGKYEEVQRVLSEAENSYFVSSVRPAVRDYALYANWLKDYPRCLEDPARCREFLMHLDLVLNTLKVSSHYRGIRNNLLVKKIEIAIKKQDTDMLIEFFKEGPEEKIAIFGFHFFLNSTFSLALSDPAAACRLIEKMKPAFPKRFHPVTDSFLELLQTQSESLREWSQLNVLTGQQKGPDDAQIGRWNNALPKLQVFFSKNVGETGVYQDLQYYKLMIAFAQTDKTDVTQAYFEKSNPELHQRFFHDLVHCTRQLRKVGKYQKAISLLKRAQIKSFKYNELIQNYRDFFSLLFSSPLQREAVLKEMQKLESCIAGLNTKDECHQELCAFFESFRIVLSLDAEEYANARRLLAQETTDLEVHHEVAALLFERMQASLQAKKGLEDLKVIIENLGSWQHLELFKAYQAYLVCEPSFEVLLESVTALIIQMTTIEQLSDFASNLQHLQKFELRLSQEKFEEAKSLLSAPMPREFYSQLCNILFMYFIHRREQQRQTVPLREVIKTLQNLNTIFTPPNSDTIQSYINFLVLLDSITGKKEIAAHQQALQSLKTVFEKLNFVRCSAPRALKEEMVNIFLEIARLAGEAGQRKIGLEALEALKEIGILDEQFEPLISTLRRLLNA